MSEATKPAQGQGAALTVGEHDPELVKRLEDGLDAFNAAATGHAEEAEFSVRVTDADGELIGGLSARAWGGLCDIHLLWVREDSRGQGWGAKLLRAAEEEGYGAAATVPQCPRTPSRRRSSTSGRDTRRWAVFPGYPVVMRTCSCTRSSAEVGAGAGPETCQGRDGRVRCTRCHAPRS